MSVVRRHCRFIPLLLAAFVGACEDRDPLAPSFAVSKGGPSVGAPTNLAATALSYEMIGLAWQDNATNEDGFEVWRSTTGPTGPLSLFTTYPWPNTTQGGNSGLQSATQYCYEVRAFKGTRRPVSYSAFSNVACATTPAVPPPPVPATPSNVNAVPWWGYVGVSWTDNSADEYAFRVERSATSDGPWTALATTPENSTYFPDRQPAPEQPVCYRVFAYNRFGDSPSSNVDCSAEPTAASGVVASATGSDVNLTWVDNSGVEDGFQVLRGDAAWSLVVVATVSANTTSYHDPNLADGTYYYGVRVTKDGGWSASSDQASVMVVTTPPAAPTGADASPAGSTAIIVGWVDQSLNETGFRVERSTDGGANWEIADTTSMSEASFTDNTRVAEQQACYRVIAFNSMGESSASNTDCATPPAAPTGLVATPGAGGAIDLSWTDNSGIEDGYQVWRLFVDTTCDDSGCYDSSYYAAIVTLGPNVTSYQDAGLNLGESYTYVVVAVKDIGYSDASNQVTATAP